MYILGDIGNSDTKLCLVSSRNKIVKRINFPSKSLNDQKSFNTIFVSELNVWRPAT